MPVQTANILKGWFSTGKKPTQQQFYDFIDSCINSVGGAIAIADVTGLAAALALKASEAEVTALKQLLFPFKFSLNANGSYLLLANMMIEKIIFTPSVETTIKIGVTPGGEEVFPSDIIAASEDRVIRCDVVGRVDTTIYFTGIVANTDILIYRSPLTSYN